MLSTNNTMTQTHALYMENKAIATAVEVGRYEIKNGNNGNLPHTPEPLKADCEELFHTLDVLLSTLGQPIFESLSISRFNNVTTVAAPANQVAIQTDKIPHHSEPILFYCKAIDAEAQGYYNDDGFVVLAGSLLRKKQINSVGKWGTRKQEEMIISNLLVEYDSKSYKLKEDYLFKTPSGAAQIVTGRNANGWLVWKNKAGQTLDNVYR